MNLISRKCPDRCKTERKLSGSAAIKNHKEPTKLTETTNLFSSRNVRDTKSVLFHRQTFSSNSLKIITGQACVSNSQPFPNKDQSIKPLVL